jgi:protein-tyrosine phosphatase
MDISKITNYLYIASRLRTRDTELVGALDELNVGLVINMIAFHRAPRSVRESARKVLWLWTIDSPLTPIPVRTLRRGVDAALPVIEQGQSVLVYCNAGRHRSVAMAAAILIARGHPTGEAMELIRLQRPVADPQAAHIRRQILKFAAHWREHRAERDRRGR